MTENNKNGSEPGEEIDLISAKEGDIFVCPKCGAPLWEIEKGKLSLFKCKLGHAFSPDRLTAEQRRIVEASISLALRTSVERSALLEKLKQRALNSNHHGVEFLTGQLKEAEDHIEVLRTIIASLSRQSAGQSIPGDASDE